MSKKVADVKLKWKASPSSGLERQEVTTTIDGIEKTVEVTPSAESLVLTAVGALTTVSFKVDTFDDEGEQTTSETFTFSLPDFEKPLPATELGFEILNVREVEDTPTDPVDE